MNLFEAVNPFSRKFLQLDKEDSSRRQQFIDNAQGKGEEDKPFIGDMSPMDAGYFGLNRVISPSRNSLRIKRLDFPSIGKWQHIPKFHSLLI